MDILREHLSIVFDDRGGTMKWESSSKLKNLNIPFEWVSTTRNLSHCKFMLTWPNWILIIFLIIMLIY